jgi:hypothetical protein
MHFPIASRPILRAIAGRRTFEMKFEGIWCVLACER